MTEGISLPRWARLYIGCVIAFGLGVTSESLYSIYNQPPRPEWLILAALTLLTGSFTVKIPSVKARISVSEAFVFASVLLFGPATGTVTVALDSFIISLWMKHDARSTVRSLFNLAAVALAIWIASHVFFLLLGQSSVAHTDLEQLALPLAVLAGLYFLINSSLVALALSAERHVNPFVMWRDNFPWLSLNYFGGASVAALLVSYTESVDLGALGIIIPLLVISYLTYRTSLGRVEDAKRHVDQVNSLYMSTIETLAMAVDAKDQITHGHIRRVQVYATELARRLGVRDEHQLKAIEAAALLHDMGKLAIPEHILNKPGKLSAPEFEKMKEHANIGADLLSAVRFPYPVVPIVRHHHEHWDGNGYPSGIAGTDIPLGARILSVVDCFDALTSDRPYRPRLDNEEAFQLLRARRGSAYDPIVVDTFLKAYNEIAPLAIAAGQQAKSLIPSGPFDEHSASAPDASFRQIRANAVDTSMSFETRRTIAGSTSPGEAFECVAQYVRQQTPATVCALFYPAPGEDALTCRFASGEGAEFVLGLTIRKGERITGWVAANQQTVTNSEAALDLSNIAAAFRQPLRSVLSAPVVGHGEIVAVLTVYSPHVNAFNSDHKYSFEQICEPLGERLSQLLDPSEGAVRPFSDTHLTRFPNRVK